MADDALLGTTLGRYRLEEVLGEGGMGRVYLGVDAEHAQRVAIKVLVELAPDQVERFSAEARAVSLISHFNIVNLIDLSELPDGRPYMVMELVEGRSLRDAAPGTSLPELMRLCREVLDALAAVHAIGIVHRDLKPDNIMVTRLGHAKVLDFGVAKLAPGVGGGLTPRTADGLTVGTPAYMAPEQVIGAAIDGRTDLYTMGVVMFEALTGHRPFDGTELELMRAHRDQAPPSPRKYRASLPPAIEHVVLRALAKDPDDRYPDAIAMSAAIEAAVRGDVPPAAADTLRDDVPTVRAKPLARPRSSRWPAMLGVSAIAIAATVAFLIARSRRTPIPIVAPEDARVAVAADAPPPIDAAPPDVMPPIDAAVAASAPVERAVTKRALPAPITIAIGGDPRAFAPVAFFPRATELARRLAPDAQPLFMSAQLVKASAVSDTALQPVLYRFISPSAAAPGGACTVFVEVAGATATAKIGTDRKCSARSVGAPRCSLAQVLRAKAKMQASESMSDDAYDTATVYWKNGAWTVRLTRTGGALPFEIPDDC